MKQHAQILLLILSLIFFISPVLAFGISIPYSNSNPLIMPAGTTQEVFSTLINYCPPLSDSCLKVDENVVVTLIEGSQIAQLVSGTQYTIPYGTDNTYIDLQVSIPQCTPENTVYNIKFTVNPIDTNGNMLSVGYVVEFPVQVTANPDITVKCKKIKKTKS